MPNGLSERLRCHVPAIKPAEVRGRLALADPLEVPALLSLIRAGPQPASQATNVLLPEPGGPVRIR